ncbi:hypothetical protein vseg_010132 [Gypsophila vaccaria]
MKLIRVAVRCANEGGFRRRFLSSSSYNSSSFFGPGNNGNQNGDSAESTKDFANRMFARSPEDSSSAFFREYDKFDKGLFGVGSTNNGVPSGMPNGDDDPFTTLTDGMEGKLKEAAAYFEVDPQEIAADDYNYRADMNMKPRMTYTPEDLNIRKTGVWKPNKRPEFAVTTKEALENADFRNVRFLANFLTEAGIIVKRSKTGISAKAQRKVAREIKIARAFGLLPFTTMGTKAFVFGKTMENLDQDFEMDPYDIQADAEDVQDPIAG